MRGNYRRGSNQNGTDSRRDSGKVVLQDSKKSKISKQIKPRVLVLYTGGTFGMELQGPVSSERLTLPQLSAESLKERLEIQVPELQHLAQCDVKILLNRDSSHIGAQEWILFANEIQAEWKKYDGIVLLHGTDTLSYTASALSFLLRPCLKPVVITGAQRPLSALRTDARTNLISAVEIAAQGPHSVVKQVSVFFGDTLFQGNRVRKKSASDFKAFESPHSPPLAIVGTQIRYSHEKRIPDKETKAIPQIQTRFSNKVLVLHITPEFPADTINQNILSQLDALILVVFQSGTGPTHRPSFSQFLERANKMAVPIILVTEGVSQTPNLEMPDLPYAASEELLKAGCLWAGTMTPECAFVKASLLLAQSQNKKKFQELWKLNLADEF